MLKINGKSRLTKRELDDIKENEEDEDYEQQADLLINNLSKLGSSSNASAESQRADLENQLKELEAERLKELRERAQEAILENMDDEISEINDKFDKLLESNHALLLAMQGDLANPNKFMTDMLTKELMNGKTSLEMESYVDDLKTRFGSVLGDKVDWEVLKEEVKQLFLNVNGQTINLSQENNDIVFKAVEAAMTQIGIR